MKKKYVAAKKVKVKKGWRDSVFYAICGTILTMALIIVLFPMLNIVSSAFSDPTAVSAGKVWFWPVDFSLESFKNVLKFDSVWIGYKNTIIYTVVGTVMNVMITLFCAYPLAQSRFAGRKFMSKMLLITMLFGGGMIPNYLLVRELELLNTRWAVLLPGLMSAYNVIITKTYIQTNISGELDDAARIDGCSPIQYFFRFILPLSKSIIAIITMYYAVGHWNSYFGAFLYLDNKELYPLQLFLREILLQTQLDASAFDDPEMAFQLKSQAEALKYSVIVIATAPLMCVYPLVQKHFVKGVMIGSVKG